MITSLLDPIGYTTAVGETGVLEVDLPSWRYDSTAEIDVIEEIARHYGYETLGKTLPSSTVHGRLSPRQARRRQLRELLLGLGLTEVMPNPFLAPDDLASSGLPTEALRLANPLVAEESILRTALQPGLLKTVAYNESHRSAAVRLFEIGHVYPPSGNQLPDEHEALGVVLAGAEAPDAVAVWREIVGRPRIRSPARPGAGAGRTPSRPIGQPDPGQDPDRRGR